MEQQFLSGNNNFSNITNNNFENNKEFIFSKSPDVKKNINPENDKIISKIIHINIY